MTTPQFDDRTPKTVLGIQYYRPPNPKVEDFKKDLENIKRANLIIIRIWIQWQQINPEENKWDFSNYDKLFKEAEKNGIKILIQINSEVPPEWLINKYPDGKWVDDKGKQVVPESHPAIQLGTYPGLTLDHQQVRECIHELIHQVVLHYKDEDCLFGYDVWNEFMPFYSIKSFHSYLCHPETKKKFQKYLQEKYKNIEKLNQIYGGRNYKSFSEVPMPGSGVHLEMLDVYEFASNWVIDYMNWKNKVVRMYDDRHPVLSHSGGSPWKIFDICEIAKEMDIWGTSCYNLDFWETVLEIAITKDLGNGKDFGFAEIPAGRPSYGPYGNYLPTPELLEQFVLFAISYEGKFNLLWQYRPERFGQESPNYGLVNENGSFNIRTERISKLGNVILENQKLFDELKFSEPDVGLLFDWRSFVLEEVRDLPKEERFLFPEILGWFYGLSKLGVNVKFLLGKEVAKNGISKNIKLVIAPLLNIEREGIISAIEESVKTGTHFLAGPYLFTYDRFTYMNEETPPIPMQKIFGSKRKELLYPDNINLKVIGSHNSIKIQGKHCLEVYDCEKGEPWIKSGKSITGTKNTVGKSICYRIGSLAGRKGFETKSEGFLYLPKNILLSAGCSFQPVSSTGNVLLRLGSSGKHKLLFIHNSEDYLQDICVTFDMEIKKVRDLIQEKEIELTNKNKFFVSLKPRETKVVLF